MATQFSVVIPSLLFLSFFLSSIHGQSVLSDPALLGLFGPHTGTPIESHHSLKAPLDKSQVYWAFGGSTVLTKDLIRLSPSTQDRRGWLWNEYPIESQWFEIEITLEVYSKPHFGGDGLGIWIVKSPEDSSFTQNPEALIGPIFGMKNDFAGVGVLLDVYDNDGKRNNPSIFVVSNPSGTPTSYNHDNDFDNDMVKLTTNPANTEINYRCVADIRNTGKPAKLLLVWLHNLLHIYVNTDGVQYKVCLAVSLPDVDLKNYHLAFTSATGQVADNMDIIEVSTRYLASTVADANDSLGSHLPSSGSLSSLSGLSGLYWTLVNLLSLFCLCGSAWSYYELRSQLSARLDPLFIVQRINPVVLPVAGAHAASTALLIFTLSDSTVAWILFIANVAVLALRAYLFSRGQLLLSAPMLVGHAQKGHAAGAGLSVQQQLILATTIAALSQLYYLYRWFA